MKKLSHQRLALGVAYALFVAGLLGACAASGPQPHSSATSMSPDPNSNSSEPGDASFPDASKAFWKEGAFVTVETMRTMNLGLSKDQVRQLLGHPHFSEGLLGSSEWNYLLHIRTGKSAESATCQYMVRFGKDDGGKLVSTGLYFKTPACKTSFSSQQ